MFSPYDSSIERYYTEDLVLPPRPEDVAWHCSMVSKSDIDSITIRPLRWQGSKTQREHPAVRTGSPNCCRQTI